MVISMRAAILSALAILGLTLVVNLGYGLVAWRDASPLEAARALAAAAAQRGDLEAMAAALHCPGELGPAVPAG